MQDNPRINRDREIRDVFKYLQKERGHNSTFIGSFIQRNYFITSAHMYKILAYVDEQPVNSDDTSIVFKIVMNNGYQNI